MKKCKYCQSEIDEKAKICPKCGKKQSSIVKWIVIVIVAVILIGAFSSGGSDEAKEDKSGSNTEQKEKFTYTISNQYSDSFSYYIEGTVTNNRDKDYSYLQIEFVCYDKDGNNLGTAIDNTNNLLANQTWKYKAMLFSSDTKVDHCDYHDITGW